MESLIIASYLLRATANQRECARVDAPYEGHAAKQRAPFPVSVFAAAAVGVVALGLFAF